MSKASITGIFNFRKAQEIFDIQSIFRIGRHEFFRESSMPKASLGSTVGVLDDRAGHSFKMSAKLNIGGDSFRSGDGFRTFLRDLYRGRKKFPYLISKSA
jgi:hypothetical protein